MSPIGCLRQHITDNYACDTRLNRLLGEVEHQLSNPPHRPRVDEELAKTIWCYLVDLETTSKDGFRTSNGEHRGLIIAADMLRQALSKHREELRVERLQRQEERRRETKIARLKGLHETAEVMASAVFIHAERERGLVKAPLAEYLHGVLVQHELSKPEAAPPDPGRAEQLSFPAGATAARLRETSERPVMLPTERRQS